jgi:membrane-associated phospholipid phosphatase
MHHRLLTIRLAAVALAVTLAPLLLNAQAPADNADTVSLLRSHDAFAALGVVAIAAGVSEFDERLALSFQRPSVQSNGTLKGAANVFNAIGFPGSIVMIAGTYFLGIAEHSRSIASLGMHTGEAVVLGGILAEGLQMSIGRARPQRDIRQAFDFRAGHGISDEDYTSLPSSHVTVAFAAATAATMEVDRSWPAAAKYVKPVSYSLASLVGLSRMYKNKHWGSDVVAAAGLGAYSALLIERYNDGRPQNIFNRLFLPSSIVAQGRGIAVSWSVAR